MTENSRLGIEHLENIGFHYALTLQKWRERFQEHSSKLSDLGFDRVFLRKWNYYFSICEAGFAKRILGDIQIVLTRPGNKRLDISLG